MHNFNPKGNTNGIIEFCYTIGKEKMFVDLMSNTKFTRSFTFQTLLLKLLLVRIGVLTSH
jgi:hypothetical protein